MGARSVIAEPEATRLRARRPARGWEPPASCADATEMGAATELRGRHRAARTPRPAVLGAGCGLARRGGSSARERVRSLQLPIL